MRKTIIVILLLAALSSNAQVINHVDCLYGSRNLRVTRIEYGDKATKVTFKTTKECAPTLKVGYGIYLVDDKGERRHAVSAEGIKFDSLYVMVKGLSRKFSVSFTPVVPYNKVLDITDPGQFRIYGLYDAGKKLDIPKVDTGIPEEELNYLTSGTDGDVEISGAYHSAKDQNGTILYFDYTLFGNDLTIADHYAKTDKSGRFHLKFHAYTPLLVFFWKGYRNFHTLPRERMYIRPGDRIELDITDWDEGKEQSYDNLSGRKAYNGLVNLRDLTRFLPFTDYAKTTGSHFRYMGYGDMHDRLLERFDKDMEFANYICWHNRLSPYESRLFLNTMRILYVSHLLDMDAYVKTLYDQTKEYDGMSEERKKLYNEDDTTMLLSLIDHMDYSYLKRIDPSDLSLIADPETQTLASALAHIVPIHGCHDMVAEDDPDRWMKVIGLQRKELERMAGWTGMPFLIQLMIVKDYPILFGWKPADDRQYRQVREMLTIPCCQTYLDLMHKQLQDEEDQRHASRSLRK